MGIKIEQQKISSANELRLEAPQLKMRSQTKKIVSNKNNSAKLNHNINEKKEPEKLTNNIQKVLEARKEYFNKIVPTNDIIKK